MSRTVRAVPIQFEGSDYGKTIERGHVSMPKLEFEGVDETWGQKGKKFRKRLISRKQRREGIQGVRVEEE
jgi:hypothetical protein